MWRKKEIVTINNFNLQNKTESKLCFVIITLLQTLKIS